MAGGPCEACKGLQERGCATGHGCPARPALGQAAAPRVGYTKASLQSYSQHYGTANVEYTHTRIYIYFKAQQKNKTKIRCYRPTRQLYRMPRVPKWTHTLTLHIRNPWFNPCCSRKSKRGLVKT